MKDISPRQKQILYYLSLEQIEHSEPVASNQIKEKYGLKFSSATIRNELFQLCQMEYLSQPHTSSGRVLSDFGWEVLIGHFLENIFETKPFVLPHDFDLLIKKLSSKTKSFSFVFDCLTLEIKNTGLEHLLNEKTVDSLQDISCIAKDVDMLKEKIQGMQNKVLLHQINVFIGKKNPLFQSDRLALICTKLESSNIIIGIITPKVTDYENHFKIFKNLINYI